MVYYNLFSGLKTAFLFLLFFLLLTTKPVDCMAQGDQQDSTLGWQLLRSIQTVVKTNTDSAYALTRRAGEIANYHLEKTLNEQDRRNYLNLKGNAQFELAVLFHMHSDFDAAERNYLLSIATHKQCNNVRSMAMTHNYLSRIYEGDGNKEGFILHVRKALALHIQTKDTVGIAVDRIAVADYQYRNGVTDSALINYEEAVELLRQSTDTFRLTFGLFQYGMIMKRTGNTKKAIELLFEVLGIQEFMGYDDGIGRTSRSLAEIFQTQGDYEKALEYYELARSIGERMNTKSIIAGATTGIASVYKAQGEYAKSLAYYEAVYDIVREVKPGPGVTSSALQNIGNIHMKMGAEKLALGYLSQALEVGGDHLFPDMQCALNMSIARCHQKTQNFNSAKHHATACFQLAKSASLHDMIGESAEILSDINRELGLFEEALFYASIATEIRDSAAVAENTKLLLEKDAYHEVKQKELELSLQEQKIKGMEEEKRWHSRAWMGFFLALLLLFSLVGLALAYGIQRRKNAELKLRAELLQSSEQVAHLQEALNQQLSSDPDPAHQKLNRGMAEILSKREVEVLNELCNGKSNKEISETLHISVNTVRTHLLNIYDKLNVGNRTQAVTKFRELGMTDT